MPAGQGYRVATTKMSGPAGELDGCGDDAEKIRKAVAPTVRYPQDALGGAASAPAFNAFATAWEAEARTLRDALHELATKVHLAKGAYAGSDQLVRTQANSVRTTDGELTTMPAFTERPSALSQY
ncbi:hypothetical protein ACFV7R_12100 [Streptomyces sp. NPDC059866]|uniref:hypothetical protein n=1 Tax=Streptomyces sp. NPDC059866 TaxID=3346978 RepID=UPI00365E0BA7